MELSFHDWRAGDQRYFVADTDAIRHALALATPVDWRAGVADLAKWLEAEGPEERLAPAEAAA